MDLHITSELLLAMPSRNWMCWSLDSNEQFVAKFEKKNIENNFLC